MAQLQFRQPVSESQNSSGGACQLCSPIHIEALAPRQLDAALQCMHCGDSPPTIYTLCVLLAAAGQKRHHDLDVAVPAPISRIGLLHTTLSVLTLAHIRAATASKDNLSMHCTYDPFGYRKRNASARRTQDMQWTMLNDDLVHCSHMQSMYRR